LEADDLGPSDRAAAGRRLIILNASLGRPIDSPLCAIAFSAEVGEDALHGLFNEVANFADADARELVFRLACENLPNSAIGLYYYARELMHNGRVFESIELLERKLDDVFRNELLVDIYCKCLHAVGRGNEIEAYIRRFFGGYSGDWFRQVGFRDAQSRSKDLPPILVVTQPKSGSVFTLNTLSIGLKAPWTYICPLGYWPYDQFIIPERLSAFAEGGAVCVEHLRPTPNLIAELRRAGVERMVLNLRDVRQAALSWIHHLRSDAVARLGPVHQAQANLLSSRKEFEASYLQYLDYWAEFQESWLEFLEDPLMPVLVTNFSEIVDNERRYFERILSFYNVPYRRFDWGVLGVDYKERAHHFRRGEAREWESALSDATLVQVQGIVSRWPRVQRLIEAEDGSAT
jgi:hypothetical protein